MDEILLVGLAVLLVEHVVVHEMLRALGAELQHDAHRGVGVDVRIVALHIRVDGIGEEYVAVGFHEMMLGLTTLCMLLAVRDVALRYVIAVGLHELFLDDILDLLDRDTIPLRYGRLDRLRDLVDLRLAHVPVTIDLDIRLGDGIVYLRAVIDDPAA